MSQPIRKKKRKILIGSFAPGGAKPFLPRFFLIHDSFWTPELPPLVTPRQAEPGPGVTTFVDTEDKLSIEGGTPTDTKVNPPNDTAFLCNVDHHVRFELTFDGSGVNIYTRFVDGNNYGARVTFHSNGTLFLFDNDGSGAAQLGFYSANLQVAQKYVCDFTVRGTVAQVYLDGVLRITYETLSNYLTQTGGYIYQTLAVNDLVLNSYPLDGVGILAVSGGKAVPAWGDPGVWIGSESDLGVQVPQVMKPGMAAVQIVEFKDTSTIVQAGFDLNKTGDIGPGRWTKNGALLRAYAGGVHIDLQPIVADELLKLIIVNRSDTNGMFFIANGKLLWPSYDQVSAQGYSALQSYNGPLDLYDIGFADLEPDGFTNDFADVTDSKTNPANGVAFNVNADFYETSTHTNEVGKYCGNYFRVQDGTNYVFWIIDTVGGLELSEIVASAKTNLAYVGGVGSDGVSVKIDVVAVGSSIKIYADNVLKVDVTSTVFLTETGGNVAHSLASNDFVLTTHPYPALGIATSRMIAPQDAQTATMDVAAFIQMNGVILPVGGPASIDFRVVDSNNYIRATILADGGMTVADVNAGTPNVLITASAAAISNGDNLVLVFDGGTVTLRINSAVNASVSGFLQTTGVVIDCSSLINGCVMDDLVAFPLYPPIRDRLK